MNKDRFEAFLETNGKRIHNYIWSLVQNENDAQDLTQISFLAFYEHIGSIDEGRALAYMYKIAHNKSLSFLKQRSRYIVKDPQDFVHIAEPVKHQTDYSSLYQAMSELPPKLASVIHLQYFESLSYKDISQQLGISVKAVESLCVRAKKLLRKKMMKDLQEKGV